jgi:hypothetical protein
MFGMGNKHGREGGGVEIKNTQRSTGWLRRQERAAQGAGAGVLSWLTLHGRERRNPPRYSKKEQVIKREEDKKQRDT